MVSWPREWTVNCLPPVSTPVAGYPAAQFLLVSDYWTPSWCLRGHLQPACASHAGMLVAVGTESGRAEAAPVRRQTIGERGVAQPNLLTTIRMSLFWDHKSCTIDDFSLVGAFLGDRKNTSQVIHEEEAIRFYEDVGSYVDFLIGAGETERPCRAGPRRKMK